MSIMDISKHIQNLEGICKDKKLNIIIFTFIYQDIKYKCFYCLSGETITIAPEGYSIAISIHIKGNELDNFLEEESYSKLNGIHKDLKTKALCNNMLDVILNLAPDIILKMNAELYRICTTKSNNYTENDRIYFYCWSRSHSGRKPTKKNLEKTRLFFGEEIYLICKINNISSRWKNKPTEKYLDL